MKKEILAGFLALSCSTLYANDVVHTYKALPFKTVSIEGLEGGTAEEIFKLFKDAGYAPQEKGDKIKYKYKNISSHGALHHYGVDLTVGPDTGGAQVYRDGYTTEIRLDGKMARDMFLILARADMPVEDNGTEQKVQSRNVICSYHFSNEPLFACTVSIHD